ncbi:MAG: hypothetical protein GY768_21990, partial [Planctomycetaceae bacterium]|nr:hypothetical protein [Planctomycetaceae bacterium]
MRWQDPVADPGGSYSAAENVAIEFNGSASVDPDGSIVQFDWDYGDNSPPDIDAGE